MQKTQAKAHTLSALKARFGTKPASDKQSETLTTAQGFTVG